MTESELIKILNKVKNVIRISEFQPIVEMCRIWLSNKGETKYEKSNREILERSMNTVWLSIGWDEKFTCKFITKFDFMENTEKAKCWAECVENYLKK